MLVKNGRLNGNIPFNLPFVLVTQKDHLDALICSSRWSFSLPLTRYADLSQRLGLFPVIVCWILESSASRLVQ